ncbi:MAG: sulfite exporter TauE/SafE family protein [Pseudomonadota bacterium]
MVLEDLFFILIALISSLVSATFGFGSAFILLGLGAYILPVKDAIALSSVLFFCATLFKSLLFRRHVDWGLAAKITIIALPFAGLGAFWLDRLETAWLTRGLGVMVLLYCLVAWTPWRLRLTIHNGTIAIASALYGFLSGLLGSGGIMKVTLFQSLGLTKEAFVGAMAATAIVTNATKMAVYFEAGLLGQEQLGMALSLVVCAFVTAWAGRRFLTTISAETFRQLVLLLLAVAGMGLLLR